MDTFAIIECGNKQYPVKKGSNIVVDKLNTNEGNEVELKVLLYSENGDIKIGMPYVEDVKVIGLVKRNFKDKKILVFKKRPKKHYKKQMGFRKHLTEIEIKDIIKLK